MDCARGIVQAGIVELIAIRPDLQHTTWGEDFKFALELFEEAGIIVRWFDERSGMEPWSLKLRLFKYTKSSTGRILGIRGGAGDLKNWMARYERAMREFKAPGKQNPVIVIIDSDDAAKGIWSFVQSITKQKPTPSDPYTHVRGNLYVVPVPLSPGESSAAIESGFDAAALAIKVDGKMFCADKTFDEKLYFGENSLRT
jgi:hypothetical protein